MIFQKYETKYHISSKLKFNEDKCPLIQFKKMNAHDLKQVIKWYDHFYWEAYTTIQTMSALEKKGAGSGGPGKGAGLQLS